MQAEWTLPEKKDRPLAVTYNPHLTNDSQNFMNPFLGYPNCPMIGRYNRGQYKIGDTLLHADFKCTYNNDLQVYQCGGKSVVLPEPILYNLRNLPEFIVNNKPANLKNVPDILPERYEVREELSVIWIISFGEIGKDFLNYLNHMYILANTLFLEEKMQRKVHYLPIYAYLPDNSGIYGEEVEKGLNFNNYRGEYMSFHLSKGSPAFSPNNMRLGVEGGKIITSIVRKPQTNKDKKSRQQYVEKEKGTAKYVEKEKQEKPVEKPDNFELNWEQMEKDIKQPNKQPPKEIKQIKEPKGSKPHEGFVHFYTSVLLEKDYRVYYHWHIQDPEREQMIKQILMPSQSIDQFKENYISFMGEDALSRELSRLLP